MPSLWEAALETERRCFSNGILESNVTIKISSSSDSINTVPSKINGSGWGCIVRNLETIIVLVLLAFNFIPQRWHHSLTLPRWRIRDFATLTLTPQQSWYWCHQHNRSAYFSEFKKSSEVYSKNNNGPKTLPCGTPDTTLTSLLRQLSTIMRCGWFDRNCVNIANTDPQIPTEQSLWRMPKGWPYQRLHWNQSARSSCPLSNALCSVWDTHKSASQVSRPFR